MTDDLRSAPVLGNGLIVVAMVVLALVGLASFNWLVELVSHWGL